MLTPARSYEEACRTFRWRIPERYNLAFDVCDRQTMAGADGHRTALIVEAADGSVERTTFHVLRLLSNRLANVLAAKGVTEGDRVAVSFGPSVEAAASILAVTRMGAVAVPIPTGLGAEPLARRLAESGAVAAVVTAERAPAVLAARARAPALGAILAAGDAPPGTDELWAAMEHASGSFAPVVTAADAPALLLYPGDGDGKPALHGHRAMPANLPAVELALDFFARPGDVLWSPVEWMSLEGLLWALLPAWHHGVPVVGSAAPFEPEAALGLMARHGVRAAFVPPRELEQLAAAALTRPHPQLRALATGPGPLSGEAGERIERAFAIPANALWGTHTTGALAAENPSLVERRPGSPGRAAPGITVEALDAAGQPLPAGEHGMLAASPRTPGRSLGWPAWVATGQSGWRDLDGYLWPEPPERPQRPTEPPPLRLDAPSSEDRLTPLRRRGE
ncbi:MAG: AMP-binding protein [Magnetospirillum sp.]|nr:AMP-binding protein [Magnetospirillum sp.]